MPDLQTLGGLTDDERAVMNHLAAAWNAFIKLPVMHGDDANDFRQAIHGCQNMIMARHAVRSFPDDYMMGGQIEGIRD